MQIDQEKIEKAIVEQAVEELVGNEDIYNRVRTGVDERINKIFKDTAEAQISEAIAIAIRKGFEHSYQKVDSFGRPSGDKTTIAEQLEKQIGGYWNVQVDKDGKPTDNSYSSKGNRAEWLMTKMVAEDFKGEMKQHIINLGGALKDKLREELHATVARLLSEVFYVRSQDDQKKNIQDSSIIRPKENL